VRRMCRRKGGLILNGVFLILKLILALFLRVYLNLNSVLDRSTLFQNEIKCHVDLWIAKELCRDSIFAIISKGRDIMRSDSKLFEQVPHQLFVINIKISQILIQHLGQIKSQILAHTYIPVSKSLFDEFFFFSFIIWLK